MASVRPMRAVAVPVAVAARPDPPSPAAPPPAAVAGRKPREAPKRHDETGAMPAPIGPGSLDGGWDRRLSRGMVAPDTTVDLHGHTLASAHAALDSGIDRALARGDRMLLLVTGKPPRPDSERPHARGAIRAAVVDWLAASRHADRIAAVRAAHPRHGGQGALYLILRRPRGR